MMQTEAAETLAVVPDIQLAWFALSVRSRHEFVAHEELVRKGIDVFLPTVVRLRQWRDRKRQIEFPVFPGYLFVHVAPCADGFLQVIKTRGTVSFVCLEPGLPTPVPEQEINALRKVVTSGRSFDVYPGYTLGTRVRIRRGPLEGAEGVLGKKQNDDLFFVNVEILGRSVGIRISADDLEAL